MDSALTRRSACAGRRSPHRWFRGRRRPRASRRPRGARVAAFRRPTSSGRAGDRFRAGRAGGRGGRPRRRDATPHGLRRRGSGEVAPFAAILLRSEARRAPTSRTSRHRPGPWPRRRSGRGSDQRGRRPRERPDHAGRDGPRGGPRRGIHPVDAPRPDDGSAAGRPGRWREEQVWIGGNGLHPGDAEFVPPVAAGSRA